jgi:predicted DNA-binding WGR domain protein
MRIFMQTQPKEDNSIRFCQLQLLQDLLGGWTLVRETGIQGLRGQVKKHYFETREDAEDAFGVLRDRQLKKGFHVVFREGV